MSNAINNPVIRRGRPAKEIHTVDLHNAQKNEQVLDGITDEVRKKNATSIIEDVPKTTEYHAQLAYNEQPIRIIINRSSEKNAPRFAECGVNGRGAEILSNDGKWMSVGWLPCGIPITTKRKYAEVLMRSRPDDYETEVFIPDGQDPINKLVWQSRQKYPLTIVEDRNPIDPSGNEWVSRIMNEQ